MSRAYALHWLEALLAVSALGVAFARPRLGGRWFARAEAAVASLATRPRRACLLVALVAMGWRAAALPLTGVRTPRVMDEHVHLLAASTFRHGRLTNPTHPQWVHFEAPHVVQRPTYASMYPPAQGMALALGAALGHPLVGVWLSMGLACAALTWMLYAWLPPAWALAGGLLFAVRLGVFSYWATSYWGGAVAMLGGALLLGAVPRLLRRPRVAAALALAAGLALLANSRPFEGLVAALPAAAVLVAAALRAVRAGGSERGAWARVGGAVALALALLAAGMAHYNRRVTGSALTLPQQVSWGEYRAASQFVWAAPPAVPAYRHAALRDFYLWERRQHVESRTAGGYLARLGGHGWGFLSFFFGPALLVPLVMLPRVARDRAAWPLLATTGLVVLALAQEVWFFPHYAAPITAAVWALLVLSLRALAGARWRGRPVGLALARSVAAIVLVMAVARTALGRRLDDYTDRGPPTLWYSGGAGHPARAALQRRLEALPGDHLVLVRYGPQHAVHREWVYNGADLDGSRVVWARDMGAAANAGLLEHYRSRRVWLLEPDLVGSTVEPPLEPYAAERAR